MILGYVLTLPDIKSDMLESLDLNSCAKFSNIYDLNILNPVFKTKVFKHAISSTYDGFVIVSEIFKQFCESGKYNGLEFVPLYNKAGFYWFKVHNIVEFDSKQRGTEFLNYSSSCNGFEEIIGATPACLVAKTPLTDGFFRTDICFGSYAGKSPLNLVGEVTKAKLIRAGFNEIYFEEILDKYNW